MLPGKFRNVSSNILEWYFWKINFVPIPMSYKIAAKNVNIYINQMNIYVDKKDVYYRIQIIESYDIQGDHL